MLSTDYSMVDEYTMQYQKIAGSTSLYDRKPENAVFITSDFMLHSFHVFLDRTFQYIEQTEFQPKLKELSNALFEKSLSEYQKASDPKLKESFGRLTVYFLIPKIYLETTSPPSPKHTAYNSPEEEQNALTGDANVDSTQNITADLTKYKTQVPSELFDLANKEIGLINKVSDVTPSPLYGQLNPEEKVDYTQFKPRSHYEKNSILRSFWKAMIWYGRIGLITKSPELTLDSELMTTILNNTLSNGQPVTKLWQDIYLPTVFFVGKSDDLNFIDYQKAMTKVYGSSYTYADLLDTQKSAAFKTEVENLPGPLIQSSVVSVAADETKQEALDKTKSFRFMGQRFIPDSYIFSSLTQGDEPPDKETGQRLPTTPTGLMVMKIMGSKTADAHYQTWIKDNWPDSDKVLAKDMTNIDTQLSKLTKDDWTQNLYWSWLYTLQPLFTDFGQGYPQFMQNQLWNEKDLATSLGSWTELRHDTLLYAKQSYAEMGGGPPDETPPPVPKGYVEPNITLINRIIALSEMTKDGLTNTGVLPDSQKASLDELVKQFKLYKQIAEDELQNKTISDAQFEALRISYYYVNGALIPPDNSGEIAEKDVRAGLIADVHTAVSNRKSEILYEATGIPNIIYVAIKDSNGTRLTRGVTYSYYEFTRPVGERLSDSDWQGEIYEGKNTFPKPSEPTWTRQLVK